MIKYKNNLPDNEFDMIFTMALQKYPNQNNKITITNFMDVLKNLKNEFTRYNVILNRQNYHYDYD